VGDYRVRCVWGRVCCDVDCWGVWGEALMVVWVGVCWGRGLRVPYGVYLWGGEWGAVAMKWDGWGEGFKAGGVEWGWAGGMGG